MRKSSAILGPLDDTKDNSRGTNLGTVYGTTQTPPIPQMPLKPESQGKINRFNNIANKLKMYEIMSEKKKNSKLQGSTPGIGCHSQPVGFEDLPIASPSAGKLALPRSLQGLATLPFGNSEI